MHQRGIFLLKTLIGRVGDRLGLHPANFRALSYQILAEFPAHAPPSRQICFFAHFDPQGVVEPYVVHYVQELRRLGFEVLFVTTSPVFGPEEAAKLASSCSRIVQRRNVALDFGSWRIAAHLLGERLDGCERLLLANDSVYGPLFDLAPLFAGMAAAGADLWGVTDSREIRYHLQSYFLVFEKPLLSSGFARDFWRDFRFYASKRRIIREYELGLTRRALDHGANVRAAVPSNEGDARNPTLFLWDTQIRERRMPFLKTEALKLNRPRLLAVRQWREIIKSAGSNYDPELIERHLARVGRAPELR